MREINGYKLTTKLTTQNAGFCQWAFCTKNQHEYFIKEFLAPVYPADDGTLSSTAVERKRKICDRFFYEKRAFYNRLLESRTGNNIIILDFFRFGSKYYIVTDRVDSMGTDPCIIASLDFERQITFIKALLYSVAKFHDNNVIHADLKPDNILLKATENGFITAKIIDFDSGFSTDRVPEEIQGDFVYLAPETYLKMTGEDAQISEKIDIFSLGILIHQYLSGELPSIGSDYKYTFEAVLDSGYLGLSSKLPEPFSNIIGRMLLKDPMLRPSAQQVLKDLAVYQIASSNSCADQSANIGFRIPRELD